MQQHSRHRYLCSTRRCTAQQRQPYETVKDKRNPHASKEKRNEARSFRIENSQDSLTLKFRHKKLCAGTMSSGTTYKAGGFSLRYPVFRTVRKGSRCYFKVAAANVLQRTTEYTGFLFSLHQLFAGFINKSLNSLSLFIFLNHKPVRQMPVTSARSCDLTGIECLIIRR